MNLHCCKHSRVPKLHAEGNSPNRKAPERLVRNCYSGKFDQPKHSGMERFLKTNKVVVKSFPVGTSEGMEDFNRPIIGKEQYHYRCRYKRVEGTKFALALQI